ncbi:MAG: hypothetical protein JOY93_03630 [Acidobacteriales bacterium]|nr:hypothetical protein [Terriglobales bacterium]
MEVLSKLLQGLAFVPGVVAAIEKLFQGRPGGEKKDAAMSFLQTALSMTEAVANRQIIDPAKFNEGLEKLIAGTVE